MMIMNRREEDYLKFKWSELKENNGPLINPLTCLHPLHFRYLFLSGGENTSSVEQPIIVRRCQIFILIRNQK
jgi:hypothetical protein